MKSQSLKPFGQAQTFAWSCRLSRRNCIAPLRKPGLKGGIGAKRRIPHEEQKFPALPAWNTRLRRYFTLLFPGGEGGGNSERRSRGGIPLAWQKPRPNPVAVPGDWVPAFPAGMTREVVSGDCVEIQHSRHSAMDWRDPDAMDGRNYR